MACGELRELARRQDASATVVLFWRPEDDAVFVVLSDNFERNAAITQVAPGEALEAYRHPYVYRDRPDPAPRNRVSRSTV